MARKFRKKEEDVDSYRHESDTCKNAVPVGIASYDTSKSKPKKYEYDPHFDNIKQQFLTALRELLNISASGEFCVGYFNLRCLKKII